MRHSRYRNKHVTRALLLILLSVALWRLFGPREEVVTETVTFSIERTNVIRLRGANAAYSKTNAMLAATLRESGGNIAALRVRKVWRWGRLAEAHLVEIRPLLLSKNPEPHPTN